MVTRKVLYDSLSASHTIMFQHNEISQGTKCIYGGEQMMTVIQMLRVDGDGRKHHIQ
jgi:hypothetical protein